MQQLTPEEQREKARKCLLVVIRAKKLYTTLSRQTYVVGMCKTILQAAEEKEAKYRYLSSEWYEVRTIFKQVIFDLERLHCPKNLTLADFWWPLSERKLRNSKFKALIKYYKGLLNENVTSKVQTDSTI